MRLPLGEGPREFNAGDGPLASSSVVSGLDEERDASRYNRFRKFETISTSFSTTRLILLSVKFRESKIILHEAGEGKRTGHLRKHYPVQYTKRSCL